MPICQQNMEDQSALNEEYHMMVPDHTSLSHRKAGVLIFFSSGDKTDSTLHIATDFVYLNAIAKKYEHILPYCFLPP